VTSILKSLYYKKSVSKIDHVLVFLANDWISKINFKLNKNEISGGKWLDIDNLLKDITKDSLDHINEFLY